MKNFFAINCTHQKDNQALDANPYRTAEASPAVKKLIDEAGDALMNDEMPKSAETIRLQKKSTHTWALSALSLAAALAFFFVSKQAGWLKAHPWLGIIEWVLLGLSIFFTIRSRKFSKQAIAGQEATNSDGFQKASDLFEDALRQSAMEMNIPTEVDAVDIFPLYYMEKGRKIVPRGKKNHFENCSTSVFLRDGTLNFATPQELFSIPLGDIVGYRFYDEPYVIHMWLKGPESDSGPYARYFIRPHGLMGRESKGYYGIEVGKETGMHYEILIPNYDFNVVQKLANIRPLTDSEN